MPTFIDAVEVVPGSNIEWTDVDISSYIPAGASGVILHIVNNHPSTSQAFGCRKNGSTDERLTSIGAASHVWLSIGVDENRIFDGRANPTYTDIYVVGYYTSSEAVFFTNAIDKSLSTTDAWTDIDIASDTGANTAIAAIFEVVNTTASNVGLRKKGNTDNLYSSSSPKHFGYVVGVDASEVCQGYISNTNADFFLVGYLKSSAVFPDAQTNLSLGSTGSYYDLTAFPGGATCGFIMVKTALTAYKYALRENGSEDDSYYDAEYYCQAIVKCDVNELVEGKIENAATDFYLVGYGVVNSQTLSLSGIPSTVTIGTPTMLPGPVTMPLNGIAPTSQIGTPTLLPGPVTLSLEGIPPGSVVGTPTLQSALVLHLDGISSGSVVGTPTLLPGPVTMAVNGIPSTAVIGAPTLTYGSAVVGTRTDQAIDLALIGIVKNSLIEWTGSTPSASQIIVEVSLDGGTDWMAATNGAEIPGLAAGTDTAGKTLTVRQILRGTAPDYPVLHSINYRVLSKNNRTGIVKFPLGVFLLSTPPRKVNLSGVVVREVEAYDQLQILIDDKIDTRYIVGLAANYITAVAALLTSAGITHQYLVPTDKILPNTRDWAPGTSKLEIINDLLSAINYGALWFNEDGYAIAQPYISPAVRPEEYIYRDDDKSVIFPNVEQGLDLFGVPNKWIAIVSEPDRDPLVSTYTNTNANSPTSTVSRGRTITDVREGAQAADQATLDDCVQQVAFEASQIYEKVTMETAIMPQHSHADVLRLEYSKLGIGAKFSETGWEMDLKAGGRMKHQIRRMVNI